MIGHQSTGYDSGTAESTELVSRLKWRFALSGLGLILIVGIGAVLALANGAANPPRAVHLLLDLTSVEGLRADEQTQLAQVASLRSYNYPITLEVAAAGPPDTAWGLWIRALSAQYVFRLRSDGYWSPLLSGGWQEFIHVVPGVNTLYLHIDPDGNAVFRINHEIAWQGTVPPDLLEWGIILPEDSPVDWRSIRLYAS